jgi:hypothetical protein
LKVKFYFTFKATRIVYFFFSEPRHFKEQKARAVGRSENIGGHKEVEELLKEKDFTPGTGKIWGSMGPPVLPVPTVLPIESTPSSSSSSSSEDTVIVSHEDLIEVS